MLATKVVAWDTLAREAGSYIDPELGDRHSDLLFSARDTASVSLLGLGPR